MSRDRDELTAAIILQRGSALRNGLLDAHRKAWSSDSLSATIRGLDDRDLLCLSIVAMMDAKSGLDEWLSDMCVAEEIRRCDRADVAA